MSPRSSYQNERIREKKSALIREAALELFAGKGYHAATISDIARRAGISKGLMYNYYAGKEELLSAIVRESAEEVCAYFDINRDGYLTEEEFVFFIRKIAQVLREKKEFWRLFFRLIMQNEVRSRVPGWLNATPGSRDSESPPEFFLPGMLETISGYFRRKGEAGGDGFDPVQEMKLFLMTLMGFAMTFVFNEQDDEEQFNQSLDALVRSYR